MGRKRGVPKTRSDSSSSSIVSNASPSPPRRANVKKVLRKKATDTGGTATGENKHLTKKDSKASVSQKTTPESKATDSKSPPKRRISPRRKVKAEKNPPIPAHSTKNDTKRSTSNVLASLEVQSNSAVSSLNTFRIPKVKNETASKNSLTEKSQGDMPSIPSYCKAIIEGLEKASSSQRSLLPNTEVTVNVKGGKSQQSQAQLHLPAHTLLSKDLTQIPLNSARITREQETEKKSWDSLTVKPEPLKAKRRYNDQLDRQGIPPALPPVVNSKNGASLVKKPAAQLQLSSPGTSAVCKTFPDLPDYEEAFEEMEWENPLPQILQMVKEPSRDTVQTSFFDGGDEMDVDPDPSEQVIIVPDTNIWIGEIDLLKNILEKQLHGISRPTIVIPWMVLQELDVDIHKGDTEKCKKARIPVNFIFSLLSKKHPNVIGQRASDAAISKLKFDEIVADDSILNCVFQNQNGNNIVILLTNDRNLLNKALVNGIHACDSRSIFQKITEIVTEGAAISCVKPNGEKSEVPSSSYLTNCLSTPQFISSPSNTVAPRPVVKRKIEEHLQTHQQVPIAQRRNAGNRECEVDDPMIGCDGPPLHKIQATGQPFSSSGGAMHEIFEALLSAFSYIIQWKMKEDYSNGWEYALKIKPPWTLRTAIKCVLAHWIANFSYVFARQGKPHFERLLELVQSHGTSSQIERPEIESNIVEAALAIFNMVDKTVLTEPSIRSCQELLTSYAISRNCN